MMDARGFRLETSAIQLHCGGYLKWPCCNSSDSSDKWKKKDWNFFFFIHHSCNNVFAWGQTNASNISTGCLQPFSSTTTDYHANRFILELLALSADRSMCWCKQQDSPTQKHVLAGQTVNTEEVTKNIFGDRNSSWIMTELELQRRGYMPPRTSEATLCHPCLSRLHIV